MRKTFALLLLIVSLPTILAAQAQSLVFNHVTVIDMTGAPPRPDMSAVVQGNRIVAVGKSSKIRIPKAARVIDVRTLFLIPGLWDMHVHLGDEDFDKSS